MLDYIVKPIVKWPGELARNRKKSPFSALWGKTLNLLETELRHLRANQVILQAAVKEEEIRLNGGLKANARPSHPGVILTFNSKHGPLSYWTDQYDDWAANVRAIALALESLRAIDRHGVNKQGSQYAGYKRLPPAENGRKEMDVDEAAKFLAEQSGVAVESLVDPGVLDLAFRAARRRLHPDNKETGSDELFVRMTEAVAVLKKELGL